MLHASTYLTTAPSFSKLSCSIFMYTYKYSIAAEYFYFYRSFKYFSLVEEIKYILYLSLNNNKCEGYLTLTSVSRNNTTSEPLIKFQKLQGRVDILLFRVSIKLLDRFAARNVCFQASATNCGGVFLLV